MQALQHAWQWRHDRQRHHGIVNHVQRGKRASCISGMSSKNDQQLENSVVVRATGSFRKDDLLLTVSPAVSTFGVIQSSFVIGGNNSSKATCWA